MQPSKQKLYRAKERSSEWQGKFGTEVHAPEWHGSTILKRRFHESVSFDQQLVDISFFLMPSELSIDEQRTFEIEPSNHVELATEPEHMS